MYVSEGAFCIALCFRRVSEAALATSESTEAA
jgi:hypothetical protein